MKTNAGARPCSSSCGTPRSTPPTGAPNRPSNPPLSSARWAAATAPATAPTPSRSWPASCAPARQRDLDLPPLIASMRPAATRFLSPRTIDQRLSSIHDGSEPSSSMVTGARRWTPRTQSPGNGRPDYQIGPIRFCVSITYIIPIYQTESRGTGARADVRVLWQLVSHSVCSGEETGGQKDGGEEAEAFEDYFFLISATHGVRGGDPSV